MPFVDVMVVLGSSSELVRSVRAVLGVFGVWVRFLCSFRCALHKVTEQTVSQFFRRL
jgi:hypothetical protein